MKKNRGCLGLLLHQRLLSGHSLGGGFCLLLRESLLIRGKLSGIFHLRLLPGGQMSCHQSVCLRLGGIRRFLSAL